MSSDELERTIPVSPPTVKRKMKPKDQRRGVSHLIDPPCRVASQLNTFTPVGMAIIIVAEVKYARVSTSIPTVNMWCAQTIKPKRPIAIMAQTIPIYPKGSFLPE